MYVHVHVHVCKYYIAFTLVCKVSYILTPHIHVLYVGVMLDHPYTVYIPLVMYIVHMISIHLYTPVCECVYTKDIGSKVGAIPTTHSGIQYVVLLHLYIVVSYVYVYIISLYKDTPAQDTFTCLKCHICVLNNL